MAARPHTSPWTTELEDFAKARWQAGDTGGQIAKQLGEGFTRNAVLSLVHRHGVAARPTPVRPKKERAPPKPRLRKPKKEPRPVRVLKAPKEPGEKPVAVVLEVVPMPVKSAPDVARVAFADLQPHQCRWPVGDTLSPDFGFCGEGRIEGKAYCPVHDKRAYVPLKPHEPKNGTELARALRRWAA